jgi:hypothetical protein
MSVDEMWQMYQADYKRGDYAAKHSFDNLILTFIFLYGVNAIELKDGVINKCSF